jgi:hypothetical protein
VSWSSEQRDPAAGVAPGVRVAPGLADEFLDSYIYWREECATVSSAYALWQHAERPDQATAFAAYRAALDREEHAALIHRECAERISLRAAA